MILLCVPVTDEDHASPRYAASSSASSASSSSRSDEAHFRGLTKYEARIQNIQQFIMQEDSNF